MGPRKNLRPDTYMSVTCMPMIIFITMPSVSLDVDECRISESFCDVNADCKNTRGSYQCLCKPGFTGDGKTCRGTSTFYVYIVI